MTTAPPGPAMDATTPRQRHRWIEWTLAALLFVLLTLWYTDPLWRHPGAYLVDPYDPLHNVCVSWWLSQSLLSGRLSGLWDLPPYFYPAHTTLAYDDPQLGVTLLGLPLYAATHSGVAAYNFVILISFPLAALGAYALARHVTGSRGAGLFCGVAWGFGAWRSGQAAHQQLLSLECLPWLLLCLHRYAETRQTKYLIGLFLLWTAQEYLCEYWGMFLILLIAPCALTLLRVSAGLSWRDTGKALAAIGLAVLAWLPAQLPFLALARLGQHHGFGMIAQFSADLADYAPARGTWLWGRLGSGEGGEMAVSPGLIALLLAAAAGLRMVRPARLSVPPRESVERAWAWGAWCGLVLLILTVFLLLTMRTLGTADLTYFGLSNTWINTETVGRALLLALLLWFNVPLRARLRGRRFPLRDLRDPKLAYVVLALLAVIWSCGYQIYCGGVWIAPGIHGLLTWLPGTRGFRVLARMGAFADLALAVLAASTVAAGLAAWRRRGGPLWARGLAATLLCLLALAENVPRGGPTYRNASACLPPMRAADAWLASQPDAPLVELPLGQDEVARMWRQTRHRKPMMNGYATFSRPGYGADAQLLTAPQSPAAVARLRALGVRYIVLDRGIVQTTSLPSPYARRYADSDVQVYTLSARGR